MSTKRFLLTGHRRAVPYWIFLLLFDAGCTSAEKAAPVACVERRVSSLVNARPDPGLPLAASQQLAVGAIEDVYEEVLCSGTLIAAGWVLTAGHCKTLSGIWFRTGPNGGVAVRVAAPRQFRHPQRDVMLIELQPSIELDMLGIAPLDLYQQELDNEWIGQDVTLAGLGATEDNVRGGRLFVRDRVADITPTSIVVNGEGRHGACSGDSGGPLLARSGDHGVGILGVLSKGSSSCRDIDVFERVDRLRSWITETIAEASQHPCGPLTWEGTCTNGNPIWCDKDHVMFEACKNHTLCGWSAAERGFRCVDKQHDPCLGVGPYGICDGNAVLRCSRGNLVRKDCDPCHQRCVVNADEVGQCQ